MATRGVGWWLVLLAAGLHLFLAWVPAADAVDFEFRVDRFELTGNVPGSIADEFNDDDLAPWTTVRGTAEEVGGYAILKSPGETIPFSENPNLVFERSDIAAPSTFHVLDEAGSFIATSTWSPLIPELPGEHYALYLVYQIGPSLAEEIAIGIGNYSPEIVGPDGPVGLRIGQQRTIWGTGPASLEDFETHVIDAADVTGDILLRIEFDDTTNRTTQSFSLDGGLTFVTPFSSIQSSISPLYSATFALSGDPAVLIPEPGTGLLFAAGLAGLAAARRRCSLH